MTIQEGVAMTEDPGTFEADETLETLEAVAADAPSDAGVAVAPAVRGRWRIHWPRSTAHSTPWSSRPKPRAD